MDSESIEDEEDECVISMHEDDVLCKKMTFQDKDEGNDELTIRPDSIPLQIKEESFN